MQTVIFSSLSNSVYSSSSEKETPPPNNPSPATQLQAYELLSSLFVAPPVYQLSKDLKPNLSSSHLFNLAKCSPSLAPSKFLLPRT
ncbi:hypothetical protein DSO57_1034194 [Entomophthora muscae]|uniref:Uncharacterized protein n=1 Tax=Entomophthora muscae TaxID=34485 RepID=A0ACC2TAX0_9FUNG|nr:hypothetical protein DSO57_1034194 [Entomophthora muscae]